MPALMLTFILLRNVGFLYSRVGAEATGVDAVSKFSPGDGKFGLG
jgi:hypothetical protein